ncbi:MAG: HAD-IA family hydrolase [Rhodobacteraceae bacterium]|nr:HAD-IA family hydrolase [Paracoccaceae bacterium]
MTVPLMLVVFDVDGTLVDSQAHILAAMDAAFAALGRPAPEAQATLGIVGLSLPVAIRRLVPDASEAEADRLVDAYKTAFQQQRLTGAGASPLYPGTRAMLDRLSGDVGLLMGLATGKSRRGLDHILALHGLEQYFVTRQVADDHPSKPHPSMLLAALAETGVRAGRAVMVGDTSYDMEMGRAAGMATIGVSWGYHEVGHLHAAGAGQVVDSMDALGQALSSVLDHV